MIGPPSWLLGVVTGIAALSVLGGDFALFASGEVGIAFAAIGAFWIGAGVAAIIDPAHAGRNAAIVATAIAASVVLLFGVAVQFRSAPAGTSTGGPNVMPPVQTAPK